MVHERVADLQRMGRLRDLLSERLLNQKQMQDEIGADRDVDASLYTGGFFTEDLATMEQARQTIASGNLPLVAGNERVFSSSGVMSGRLTCRLIKRPLRLGRPI